MPALQIHLAADESIIAVSGELSWMTSAIELTTTTQFGGGGGLFGTLKRVVGGGSLFMTEYRAQGGEGTVACATKLPGHILPVDVSAGQPYLIHRHGFLCATPGVDVLQKLAGECQAFVELGGEIVTYDLAAGETLRVHPGHVGMFEAGVRFDITRITGIRNMLFRGDGIFLAALTGPGRVWLQTLTVANFAHALAPYLPGVKTEAAEVGAGAVIGSVIRGLTKS